MSTKWKAIKVTELELSQEIEPVTVDLARYNALIILVRCYCQPVGWVGLKNLFGSVVSPTQIRQAIEKQLGWDLVQLILGEQIKPDILNPKSQPPISIGVYYPYYTDQAAASLAALLELDYPEYELIVVANDLRTTGKTPPPHRRPVRYIYEQQMGLNQARNRAIGEASHEIIAFIDAAARPDRYWLTAIANAFVEPDVMAVTGLVAPAELETGTQILFEYDYGGLSRGFTRRTIRRDEVTITDRREKAGERQAWLWRETLTTAELLSLHHFGVGHNMAFRRKLFATVGLFETVLGEGISTHISDGGSGHIEMFHRLVVRDHTLIYEPAALTWQRYPEDETSLRRWLYDNSRAFGAYLLYCAHSRTLKRRSIFSFAFQEWLLKSLLLRLYRPPGNLPRRLVISELAGALSSPFSYIRARLRMRGALGGSLQKYATPSLDTSQPGQ